MCVCVCMCPMHQTHDCVVFILFYTILIFIAQTVCCCSNGVWNSRLIPDKHFISEPSVHDGIIFPKIRIWCNSHFYLFIPFTVYLLLSFPCVLLFELGKYLHWRCDIEMHKIFTDYSCEQWTPGRICLLEKSIWTMIS